MDHDMNATFPSPPPPLPARITHSPLDSRSSRSGACSGWCGHRRRRVPRGRKGKGRVGGEALGGSTCREASRRHANAWKLLEATHMGFKRSKTTPLMCSLLPNSPLLLVPPSLFSSLSLSLPPPRPARTATHPRGTLPPPGGPARP